MEHALKLCKILDSKCCRNKRTKKNRLKNIVKTDITSGAKNGNYLGTQLPIASVDYIQTTLRKHFASICVRPSFKGCCKFINCTSLLLLSVAPIEENEIFCFSFYIFLFIQLLFRIPVLFKLQSKHSIYSPAAF